MVRVDELFHCSIGKSFDLNKLEQIPNGVNYLGMTSKNNGVTARVSPVDGVLPHFGDCIACPLKANVLMATVQMEPFYCTQNMAILRPKSHMTLKVLLYYSLCLQANAFRYNFGRNGHLTYKALQIPSLEEIPDWVETLPDPLEEIETLAAPFSAAPTPPLDTSTWEYFNLVDLFELKRGTIQSMSDLEPGPDILISSSSSNNGEAGRFDLSDRGAPIPGNVLTVVAVGEVGITMYQARPFYATVNVTSLVPKFKMSAATGLFIKTVLELERFRYSYGRILSNERLKKTRIKLPTINGQPDYEWMAAYIKTLPFSSCLKG